MAMHFGLEFSVIRKFLDDALWVDVYTIIGTIPRVIQRSLVSCVSHNDKEGSKHFSASASTLSSFSAIVELLWTIDLA